MVNKKLFLKSEKRRLNSNVKKYNSRGSKTPTYVEERMNKYVDYNGLNKNNVPTTNEDIRDYIINSVTDDPNLRFLKSQDRKDWDIIVTQFKSNSKYLNVLESLKQDIIIKDTNKQRKGIPLRETADYYFIVVRGRKIKQQPVIYKRYYSTTTGKQVPTKKVEMFIDIKSSNDMKDVEEIKSIKKKKTALRKLKEKEAKQKRVRRLRGKK